MYRFGWGVRWVSPRRRLTATAGFVAFLMVAQFALVVTGAISARVQANRALDDTFLFLADVSEERVLAFSQAAEQSVIEVGRQVAGQDFEPTAVLEKLHTELAIASELRAVAVTYANGDYLELRRVGGLRGGFSAYIITHDADGILQRRTVEYDSAMLQESVDRRPIVITPRDSARFSAAARSLGSVWSEPALDPVSASTEVWLSRAHTESAQGLVVVSASVMLDELSRRLNELPSGSDGEVCLLSGGRMVIASQSTPSGENTEDTPETGACSTTHGATAQDGDVWGSSGAFRTLERGLQDRGVDWVLHLDASTSDLNRGFSQVRVTFRVVIVGMALVTLALGYLLFRVWRPVSMMRDDAEHDTLTGLRNRRDFDAAVERTLRTAERVGGRVAVVMLDVDYFKRINDELGHSAGDRALKSLGKALSHTVRSSDTAVRWGGDEFLLVLLIAASEDARSNVDAIRVRLEEVLQRVVPGIEGLGVTAGYTVCARSGVAADVLVAEADRALVAGKAVKKGQSYAAGSL
ncbi:MAG: GGDEF domain-containing protein [Demequinaceae bacterium]|nr:GGDEF domain-containing protein [Demequinaceae bacterium]